MAFTEEEKQEILEVVKAESKSVESLETVGSLSGVKSLPAQKGDKLVNVPITLLGKPADDAAARAIKAAEKAEAAAKKAEDAIAQGYKHEEMSEEEFESLPEKDGKTIYLIYEEEQG